jgi:hypothetical protein
LPNSRPSVFTQYRTENLRVVSVFGSGVIDVWPRVGHVHITMVWSGAIAQRFQFVFISPLAVATICGYRP